MEARKKAKAEAAATVQAEAEAAKAAAKAAAGAVRAAKAEAAAKAAKDAEAARASRAAEKAAAAEAKAAAAAANAAKDAQAAASKVAVKVAADAARAEAAAAKAAEDYREPTSTKAVAAFDWRDFSRRLPTGLDHASVDRRKVLWLAFDASGNGLMSLAEFDRGLREVFSSDKSQRVHKAKPPQLRAFKAAAQSDQSREANVEGVKGHRRLGVSGLNDDDFVSFSEFRTLLVYFRQYLELWFMFEAIDVMGNAYATHADNERGDRKITLGEFNAAVPSLEAWGNARGGQATWRIEDAASEFAKIDLDRSGAIRFDEFANWALKQKLHLGAEGDGEGEKSGDELVPPPAEIALGDADQIALDAEREHEEGTHTALVIRQLGIETRKLVPPSPLIPGWREMRHTDGRLCWRHDGLDRTVWVRPTAPAPSPPKAVRKEKLGPLEEGHPLTPMRRRLASRYLGQYNLQYKARMINEMRSRLASPKPLVPALRKQERIVPTYEAERMVWAMEEAQARRELPPGLSPSSTAVSTTTPLLTEEQSRRAQLLRELDQAARQGLLRSQPTFGQPAMTWGERMKVGRPDFSLLEEARARTRAVRSARSAAEEEVSAAKKEGQGRDAWQWPHDSPRVRRPASFLIEGLGRSDPMTIRTTSATNVSSPRVKRLLPSELLPPMKV